MFRAQETACAKPFSRKEPGTFEEERVLACPKCHEQEGAVGSKAKGRVGGIRLRG